MIVSACYFLFSLRACTKTKFCTICTKSV